MTESYRCIALSTPEVLRYRKASVDDFGYPIQRLRSRETYPCRHCLREASAERGVLLLSHQLADPRSVYGHPTAIFLCAQECPRFDATDTVAPIVANRHVSFRAFDRHGMMLYAASELAEGSGHGGAIRRIFRTPEVAFINAHTAKAGCMLCHITRATV
jgi:hypothetical protein